MKAFRKLFLCAAVAASLLPGRALAMVLPDDPGYTITSYDVHAVVSASGFYDVDETIAVNFTEEKHGIYRDIPVGDGSSVQNVSVDGSAYSMDNDGQTVQIKIGDPDVTVQGDQTYKLHYTYVPGSGGSTATDGMVYNIIGTAWNTTIDHVTFTIEMPKPFDRLTLGFTQGAEGSPESSSAHTRFSIDGNTISGELTGQLASGEGLQMHLQLPEDYFAAASVQDDNAGQQAQVPSGGADQIFPPENGLSMPGLPGGLLLSGALVGVVAFGGVILVVVIIAVAVLANRGRAPGGTVQNNPGMLQNMQQEELLREQQRQMHQDFSPPPPPPPPPPGDMGGGSAGGGGGAW